MKIAPEVCTIRGGNQLLMGLLLAAGKEDDNTSTCHQQDTGNGKNGSTHIAGLGQIETGGIHNCQRAGFFCDFLPPFAQIPAEGL